VTPRAAIETKAVPNNLPTNNTNEDNQSTTTTENALLIGRNGEKDEKKTQ
jgi:hypothetical protein